MKKLLFAFMMVLIAIPSIASIIGVYSTEALPSNNCAVDVASVNEGGVPVTIYVMAILKAGELGSGITAAEFKLTNWIGNPGYPTGSVAITPTSDLIIGELGTDYSIAWSGPQGEGVTDRMVLICSIEITMFDAAWIPANTTMEVVKGDDGTAGIIMVDHLFELVYVTGESFTFNCSTRDCGDCYEGTLSENSSWSSVKTLF